LRIAFDEAARTNKAEYRMSSLGVDVGSDVNILSNAPDEAPFNKPGLGLRLEQRARLGTAINPTDDPKAGGSDLRYLLAHSNGIGS
jgi:hypothetical protein